MSVDFSPRDYPSIVRDLLTTLTGGTVRESVLVSASGGPIVLDRLADRPIRRVSHLVGVVDAPTEEEPTRTLDYQFTAADFELISLSGDGELDAIRFRDDGRQPPPGSTVTVNYYPVQTNPVPLTDLNVGSVARTLLETVAREIALEELQLEHVYRSAYLETAEGSPLDRVVALIGVTRVPQGESVVKVRFSRQASSTGRITIPAGTVVTDGSGNRFATMTTLVLEPGEPSREVLSRGLTAATEALDAGVIDRLEVLVAGISAVTNDGPTYRLAEPESDDNLRRRARQALQATSTGTLDAIRFGVMALPGVKNATITEEPNDVPGEIAISVAYEQPPDAGLLAAVEQRIDDVRPAGIRVIPETASQVELTFAVSLTLAGAGAAGAELDDITSGVEDRIVAHVKSLQPAATVRGAQLVALALADPRIVDASITVGTSTGPSESAASVTLQSGEVATAVTPFNFATPTAENPTSAVPSVALVDAFVPLHLLAGVSEADASEAIQLALTTQLATLASGDALTVDDAIAAMRDDTRYALVRDGVLFTIESGDRFLQLTDGLGSYEIAPIERLELRTTELDIREGSP